MKEKTMAQSLRDLKRLVALTEVAAQNTGYSHLLQEGIASATWTLNATLGLLQNSQGRESVKTHLRVVGQRTDSRMSSPIQASEKKAAEYSYTPQSSAKI